MSGKVGVMVSDENQVTYGNSHELFVTAKANGDSVVMGGVAQDSSRWVRILSNRAAQLLWFQLAQLLFPDQAKSATTVVTTAPMRDASLPTVTAHCVAERKADGLFVISGWAGSKMWQVQIEPDEMDRFWPVLDGAMYPGGSGIKASEPAPNPTPSQ